MEAGWYEGYVRMSYDTPVIYIGADSSLIWAAEGMGKGLSRVSVTYGHTLVAGDMQVSRKCTGQTVNQGGTADIVRLFVLGKYRIIYIYQGFFVRKQ